MISRFLRVIGASSRIQAGVALLLLSAAVLAPAPAAAQGACGFTPSFGPATNFPVVNVISLDSMAVGDFNGDGAADLAVANGSDTLSVCSTPANP